MESEKKEIVKQYIENILNTGDAEELSKFVSPHYTEILNNKRYRLGLKGIERKIADIRGIYPDLKLSIDLQITEGDWVITSYVMNGTQLGCGMGIKPTGKPVEVRGININKVIDGKITEHGSSTDLLDPLIETGQNSKNWIQDTLHKRIYMANEEAAAMCEAGAV